MKHLGLILGMGAFIAMFALLTLYAYTVGNTVLAVSLATATAFWIFLLYVELTANDKE